MADILPPVAPDLNAFQYLWNLGYRRLCPVIPPGAELNPRSRIHTRSLIPGHDPRGKAPGTRHGDGRWTGFNFVRHEARLEDCALWAEMGASAGIKTGRGLVAIDIDTTDRDTSRDLYNLAHDMLGAAPLRFGNKPKALLLYAITKDVPYDKVTFSTPTEDRALVEILGEGRQFVSHGIHPGTMQPYAWATPLVPRPQLPEITPEQLQAFMDAVQERFTSAHRFTASEEQRGDVDQARLRAEPRLVADAVKHLPNRQDDFPSRDDYLRVGYAIKAALGPDLEDEALDLFLQWCGRWDEGYNDPAIAEEDWSRMKPPFGVGAGYLFDKAEQLGGWPGRAQSFFTAEAAAPPRPGADVFELLDIDDILSLPDPKYLIDRHLPETGVGFLYGRPGSGKSFLALDGALHLAYGLPAWHGDAIRARPGANVLYLAKEGSSGFKARIRAWKEYHDVPAAAGKPGFRLVRQTINFRRPDDIAKIVRTARAAALAPLDLIVVDTVSRVIAGADENMQAEMTLFTAACTALSDEFGCVVLGVHHTGKNGDMRGSSVLRGDGDFVFRLDREQSSRTGTLTCEKQKDGPDGWHNSYRFTDAPFDGGVSWIVSRVTAEEEEAVDQGAEEKLLRAIARAWEMGCPWSSEVRTNTTRNGRTLRYAPTLAAREFKISTGAAAALLQRLEDSGRVRMEPMNARVRGYRVLPGDIFS